MEKKPERVFRDRELTPDERASDALVRQHVEREFPPAQTERNLGAAKIGSASSLSELLRQSISQSGKSTGVISHEAGVSQVLIDQFLSGERDIHMTTADKLAEAMELKITAN